MLTPFRAPALAADADTPDLYCVCADCGCARCLVDFELDDPGREPHRRPTAALPQRALPRYPLPPT
jgi:hypothetical protein